MRGHADRNASIVIGQRLINRYQKPLQEKPQAPLPRVERVSKETGVSRSQDAKSQKQPSISKARRGERNRHGTALEGTLWMDERPPIYTYSTTVVQRVVSTRHILRRPRTEVWKKLPGFNPCGVSLRLSL
jgi:hypothetical protein